MIFGSKVTPKDGDIKFTNHFALFPTYYDSNKDGVIYEKWIWLQRYAEASHFVEEYDSGFQWRSSAIFVNERKLGVGLKTMRRSSSFQEVIVPGCIAYFRHLSRPKKRKSKAQVKPSADKHVQPRPATIETVELDND